MLPFCFPIQEDELFQGWLHSLADSSNMSFPDFAKNYLGEIGDLRHKNKRICDLNEIVSKYYGTNSFFPDLYTIIEKHTDYITTRLCTGEGMAAHILECMLKNKYQHYNGGKESKIHYNICPLCQSEDIKKYHRALIHVSHQVRGVKVCYKHGYAFYDDIQDANLEQKIAIFAKDLLCAMPDCTLVDLKEIITIDDVHKAISAGYINKSEGIRLIKIACRSNGRVSNAAIRFLAWKFSGNIDELVNNVKKHSIAGSGDNRLKILKSEYGIGEYFCNICRHKFYKSNRAITAGEVCPYCRWGMTDEEQMKRILSRYKDGNYLYKDGKLIHTLCGYETKATTHFWLTDQQDCLNCRGKFLSDWVNKFKDTDYDVIGMIGKRTVPNDDWNKSLTHRWVQLRHSCGYEFAIQAKTEFKKGYYFAACPKCFNSKKGIMYATDPQKKTYKHVGERRVGVNGIGCEVIDKKINSKGRKAIVRFDNGIEKEMRIDDFKKIGKGTRDRLPELYIGLVRPMKDGREGIIEQYESSKRILVRFQDKTCVWSNFKRFLRGTV